MPSKNDLSALKTSSKKAPILPVSKPVETAPKQAKLKTVKTGNVGRPKKNTTEKRSHKVQLSLTEADIKAVEEKAGLANSATYLYAELKNAGVFD